MNTTATILLAIESAVGGGSVSLLRDGVEVANWAGTSNVSKAEDLLANIDALLTADDISRNEITQIAVSAGPGSFTGIRIGIATALGLKTGLGITMSSESALKAMVFAQTGGKSFIAALPVGRNAVCLQELQKNKGDIAAVTRPNIMSEDSFFNYVENERNKTHLLHSALYEKITPRETVINFGANIAFAIGLICLENPGVVTDPLFISKNF